MDRLVKFVGNGPAIIINPKYVVVVGEYRVTGGGAYSYIDTINQRYLVAGTPGQVAEALGYQLVTFDPATGLSEGSEEAL